MVGNGYRPDGRGGTDVFTLIAQQHIEAVAPVCLIHTEGASALGILHPDYYHTPGGQTPAAAEQEEALGPIRQNVRKRFCPSL